MKDSLKPGITNVLSFTLPEQKMVPGLYPEAPEFQTMPPVFATGYMVGFLEWACLQSIIPYLDWPREQSVGTHVDVSHEAATPAGMTVTARTRLIRVDGRRLLFEVEADDGVEIISRGTHERFVINTERFNAKVQKKKEQS
jgi:fluoroacetyl-CoA thioesterase